MFIDQVNSLLGASVLQEGSNIRTGNLKTEPINFVKAKKNKYTNRKDFVETFSIGFKALNEEFKAKTNIALWETNFVDCAYGTSKALFNNEGATLDEELGVDEFTRDVRQIGDVNLAIDNKKLQSLYSFTTKLRKTFNQSLRAALKESETNLTLEEIRIKNLGKDHRIITSWKYDAPHKDSFITQVVFEGMEFKAGKPTELKFEMSQSNYKDMVEGIKGQYHKKLLSTVIQAASLKENVLVAFNPSKFLAGEKTFLAQNKKPITSISTRDFDRTLGMIRKYVPLLKEDGSHVTHAGKQVFRRISESETIAESSMPEAMKYAFSPIVSENAMNKDILETNSFVGLCKVCSEYFTGKHSAKRKFLVQNFVDANLFGEEPSDLEDFNEDWKQKSKLLDKLVEIYLIEQSYIDESKTEYYNKWYKKSSAKTIYNKSFMNEKTKILVNNIHKYLK